MSMVSNQICVICLWLSNKKTAACIKVKVPPAPLAHRAAPISVSSSPRPHVCECSESYDGWGLVHR